MSKQVFPRGGGLLDPLLRTGAALKAEPSPAQALNIMPGWKRAGKCK